MLPTPDSDRHHTLDRAPIMTLALALTLSATASPAPATAQAVPISSAELAAFEARPIGPAVTGGRVADIDAVEANPSIFWVASASGGLWKTTTRGHKWVNTFEDQSISTFGDVAIYQPNPDIVYAGTGEQNNRQSTSWGNGVYRTDDGGETWTHLGLVGSRHVGKIEIHPSNSDIVYVAALGNLWAPNEERGVFRSTDGGQTWEKVLYVDEHTGVVDMVMDPSNPDILYAATYQRLRRTWGFNGGGPGSGIWKSTDGGDTWNRLGAGLPDEEMGRIGIAIARSNPQVLMALVETGSNSTTGIYRSEDAGLSWTMVNDENIRPMYYSEIFIDPNNDQRVYTLATRSHISEDGGRTLTEIAERHTYDVGVHSDHHALWIDPNDPDHLYMGGDAGLHESYDRGVNFRKINNFLISQFYDIGVDNRDPYWVYGGLQDNHSFIGPSETRSWAGILNDDWRQSGFGDGMYWESDMTDFRNTYGTSNDGSYFRFDPVTGDMLDIEPNEPPGDDYRFDWTSPLMVSTHDPSTIYVAGNRLFISHDRGSSWTRTEDLSKQVDRDTVPLMGVLGGDIDISRNDGTGSYGEAVTLDESPIDPNILWVGFDDGNLQVSQDAGESWTEVSGNVPGLPPGTYVSRIMASGRDRGHAWATFDAHRDGDFAPYVYYTTDFGRTWEPRHAGLPTGSVNVVVEHPDNFDVVFLGTEHFLFATTDHGRSWERIPGTPTTAYDDLVLHPRDKDLVLGTHGRGIWIIDDVGPLADWTATTVAADAHLFDIPLATIKRYWKDTSYRGNAEYAGENPADGVYIYYRLGAGSGDARLTMTDGTGKVVRELIVPSAPGVHRVNWDLSRGDEADQWEPWESPVLARPTYGKAPEVMPGTYTVTLNARGTSMSKPVVVRADPATNLTAQQFADREAFIVEAEQLAAGLQEILPRLREAQASASGARAAELEEMLDRVQGAMRDAARAPGQLGSGGVRQGTLHPPTETMKQELTEARAALTAARSMLGGGTR